MFEPDYWDYSYEEKKEMEENPENVDYLKWKYRVQYFVSRIKMEEVIIEEAKRIGSIEDNNISIIRENLSRYKAQLSNLRAIQPKRVEKTLEQKQQLELKRERDREWERQYRVWQERVEREEVEKKRLKEEEEERELMLVIERLLEKPIRLRKT